MGKKKLRKSSASKKVDWLGLPKFAQGPDEAIEILGRNTIMVEGAKGIHTYEQAVVRIRMKGYLLALYGSEWSLAQFEDGCLQLKGNLQKIGWEE